LIPSANYFSNLESYIPPAAAAARAVPLPAQQGVPRRAQIARATRNRVRATAEPEANQPPPLAPFDQSDNSDDDGRPVADFSEEKIGTKKRAKLEAKAEKKAQREVELKLREEQKVKDQQTELERKKLDEKERQEELRKAEEEQKAREEQERREHEEYLKMKAAFSVEEEGFDEQADSEKENLLQEFIDYIKNNKVVVLEDLAAHFKLKTQAAIDRIVDLQKENRLSGGESCQFWIHQKMTILSSFSSDRRSRKVHLHFGGRTKSCGQIHQATRPCFHHRTGRE
jgi:DDRGK domain-containing protein 1